MNQIITQHGWGFDSQIWCESKNQFNKNGWLWQDNERGYFNKRSKSSKWFKENSKQNIRMAICHSLGTHLIGSDTLLEATHAVLINTFFNFIPKNPQTKKLTIKALNRMRKKIQNDGCQTMIEEFIRKSYSPNCLDFTFNNLLNINLNLINRSVLLNDFDKLFITYKPKKLFSDNINLLILKSEKDMILQKEASNDFIKMLTQNEISKIKIIELEHQGHITTKIELYEIVQNWLNELHE